MDSKPGRKAHLKKYLSHNGKWQFFPVVKVNRKPKLVLIEGKPRRSTDGTFYLDWRENGKRLTRPVGTSPREALDAWQLHSGILSGEAEAPEEEPSVASASRAIRAAVETNLAEVKATKGAATFRAYSGDLAWFQTVCKKHYVDQLGRSDAMALFAAGRSEELNQKTINKRVIVMLQAMRHAGASIQLRKGDWPRTTDILVTYGPRYGILDKAPGSDRHEGRHQLFCRRANFEANAARLRTCPWGVRNLQCR
jgi:hypothetical protein